MRHPITYFLPKVEEGELHWYHPQTKTFIPDWQHTILVEQLRKKRSCRWEDMEEFEKYLKELKKEL